MILIAIFLILLAVTGALLFVAWRQKTYAAFIRWNNAALVALAGAGTIFVLMVVS